MNAQSLRRPRRRDVMIGMTIPAMISLGGCSAGALRGGSDSAATTLTLLVDADQGTQETATNLAEAFHDANPDIVVVVEGKPSGTEGDNLLKTRLQTGSMTDMFTYGSGSLFQQIDPPRNLTPLTGDSAVDSVDEAYVPQVSAGEDIFGIPWGTTFAGGVMYNRLVLEDLGLDIPRTWDDLIATAEAVKDAGLTAIVQTYGETWTAQVPVLGDFHNVTSISPDWAEEYTANRAKFSTDEQALAGFQHLEEIRERELTNADYASATVPDGLRMLAAGEAAMYPILSGVLSQLQQIAPDSLEDIGFFALPGQDPETNGLTAWFPNGLYVPQSTTGEQLEATKRFLAFVASPDGCSVVGGTDRPSGPFMVEGCELPEDVPRVTRDIAAYFEEGRQSPALEFLSPVKGPALEQLCVEVGSGITSAEEAAALYDQDVEKQAQQLGLEGW